MVSGRGVFFDQFGGNKTVFIVTSAPTDRNVFPASLGLVFCAEPRKFMKGWLEFKTSAAETCSTASGKVMTFN